MRKISLPLIPLSKRWHTVFLGIASYCTLYFLLGRYHITQPVFMPLTDLDEAIPLLPWTLSIYVASYALIIGLIVRLKDAQQLSRLAYSLIFGLSVGFIFFLIYPTIYPRPDISKMGAWGPVYDTLYSADPPSNCLPSMHVFLTLIVTFLGSGGLSRWLRWAIYAMAVAICLSTLTTKQHYFVDVLAGAGLSVWTWHYALRMDFRNASQPDNT